MVSVFTLLTPVAADALGKQNVVGVGMPSRYSSRSSVADARKLARNLGIDIIYQGQHDKLLALEDLMKNNNLTLEQIAFVGDDVVDLPILVRVGLAIAVQDAHPLVVKHCHWQTRHPGGHGAARDVCEMLLETHDLIEQEWLKYLSL